MSQPKAKAGGLAKSNDLSSVVVWLTPVGGSDKAKARESGVRPELVQQNKAFVPHVLAVQAGSSVLFPNHDHFLHNVFSLHDGKRFDLGFYEAGSAKAVRFDRPGISFLFCNIHPEMSAAVIAVDTPYFATSDRTGRVLIAGVPDGKYTLHVWAEQSLPEDLAKLERDVTVDVGARTLGTIRIAESPNFNAGHKNKYGEDYVPAAPGVYGRP
jgi:plastocyanin